MQHGGFSGAAGGIFGAGDDSDDDDDDDEGFGGERGSIFMPADEYAAYEQFLTLAENEDDEEEDDAAETSDPIYSVALDVIVGEYARAIHVAKGGEGFGADCALLDAGERSVMQSLLVTTAGS